MGADEPDRQPDRQPDRHPKALLSYSHDSDEHRARVLALSDRLRDLGIDCMIDRYVLAPPLGWPKWMDEQVEWADFVLVVCTERYRKRAEGKEQPGVGNGVRFETTLLFQELYEAGTRYDKYVPVLFEKADRAHVPRPLAAAMSYLLEADADFESLYRRLTNQPEVAKKPLGKIVAMPPRNALAPLPPRAPRDRSVSKLSVEAVREQLRTALTLDRTGQWKTLVAECRRSEHVYFLLHGEQLQDLRYFVERIHQHIAVETRPHLPVELQYQVQHSLPTTARVWMSRVRDALQEALGHPGNATAEGFLRDATRHQAVLLIVALRHTQTFNPLHQEALHGFITRALPEALLALGTAHPVRLLVAIDHDRQDVERRHPLVAGWMEETAAAASAGLLYRPLDEVTFPDRPEVVEHLHRQRVGDEMLREGHPIFEDIMSAYDRMCRDQDDRFALLAERIDQGLGQ